MLKVNVRQKGNPLLQYLRQVPWTYAETTADYETESALILFLSLCYSRLHPDYVHERMRGTSRTKRRILCVQIDVDDYRSDMMNLENFTYVMDFVIVVGGGPREIAQMIEALKTADSKNKTFLRERQEGGAAIPFLTALKCINKTDAVKLLSRFKTIKGICAASERELEEVKGIGAKKIKKLQELLDMQFEE